MRLSKLSKVAGAILGWRHNKQCMTSPNRSRSTGQRNRKVKCQRPSQSNTRPRMFLILLQSHRLENALSNQKELRFFFWLRLLNNMNGCWPVRMRHEMIRNWLINQEFTSTNFLYKILRDCFSRIRETKGKDNTDKTNLQTSKVLRTVPRPYFLLKNSVFISITKNTSQIPHLVFSLLSNTQTFFVYYCKKPPPPKKNKLYYYCQRRVVCLVFGDANLFSNTFLLTL